MEKKITFKVVIEGPLYHGGRAKLSPGNHLTPGQKVNPNWGDYAGRSPYVYFTTELGTAREYAHALGTQGRIYEVEPTGAFAIDYSSADFKSKHPLRIIREIPR